MADINILLSQELNKELESRGINRATEAPKGILSDIPRSVGKLKSGRPIIDNKDGTFSTHRAIIINIDGKERLIPTMFKGVQVSDKEAIETIIQNKFIDPDTGKKIPSFKTVDEAERFEKKRHLDLERQIRPYIKPID